MHGAVVAHASMLRMVVEHRVLRRAGACRVSVGWLVPATGFGYKEGPQFAPIGEFDMPWWGWMGVGMLLLAAELLIIEADFYLVFLGVAAVLTGLLGLAVPALPPWGQWLVFAVLALISMVFFRKRVYRLLRRDVADLANDLLREPVELPAGLAVDGSCRVELRGSTWTARNVGPVPIAPGGTARVVGVDGITLRVEAGN